MPNLLVRNLSEATLAALKARARRNNRSTQAEVAEILEREARPESGELEAAIAQAKRESAGKSFPDAAEIVRADRAR
jgi:plasmid stability protein